MPKTGPILLIVALVAACSSAGSRRLEQAGYRAAVHVSSPDPVVLRAIEYAERHRPPLTRCQVDGTDHGGPCVRCSVEAGRTGEEIARSWSARASDRPAAFGWLLGVIQGADDASSAARWPGLQPQGDELRICFTRPTPDWSQRLWHRSLWLTAGPSTHSVVVPRPDRDDVDLRILSGRALSQARAHSPERLLRRLPGWDARYALWVDRSVRWASDPVFRRWLAATIDRDSIVRLLFDGHASADTGWVAERIEPLSLPERRAFASDSRPRIGIAVQSGDPAAHSIAARLKAQLAVHGVDLTLRVDIDPQQSNDRPAIWLLSHRPTLKDPLLGLLETLQAAGPVTDRARRQLHWATTLEQPSLRARRAEFLERQWVADAVLIPLVAVESWLSRDATVEELEIGSFGVIGVRGNRR